MVAGMVFIYLGLLITGAFAFAISRIGDRFIDLHGAMNTAICFGFLLLPLGLLVSLIFGLGIHYMRGKADEE